MARRPTDLGVQNNGGAPFSPGGLAPLMALLLNLTFGIFAPPLCPPFLQASFQLRSGLVGSSQSWWKLYCLRHNNHSSLSLTLHHHTRQSSPGHIRLVHPASTTFSARDMFPPNSSYPIGFSLFHPLSGMCPNSLLPPILLIVTIHARYSSHGRFMNHA